MTKAPAANGDAPIRADGLRRVYGHDGESPTVALDDVSMAVQAGELVAIQGRSGSGKTTLLNLTAGLDDPDEGTVHLLGEHVAQMGVDERLKLRARSVGVVFQKPALVPELTLGENVQLAPRIRGDDTETSREAAMDALEQVGLAGLENRFPAEVSGGEAHRASVARALAKKPAVLLADEPTANLDHETAHQVAEVIADDVRSRDVAGLVVTHDDILADAADRTLNLKNGKMEDANPP